MKIQNQQILDEQREYYKDEFLQEIYKGNYCLYLDLLEQKENYHVSPAHAFLPNYLSSVVVDDYIDTSEEFYVYNFNSMINEWKSKYNTTVIKDYELDYLIRDNTNDNVLTNSIDSLNLIMERTKEANEFKSKLAFYIVFQYDEDGNLKIPIYYGVEDKNYRNLLTMELNKDFIKEQLSTNNIYQNQVNSPKDVTIIYATKLEEFYFSGKNNYITDWQERVMFENSGFGYIFAFAIIASILIAIILPFKKSLELGKNIFAKVPFEFSLFSLLITYAVYESFYLPMAMETAKGYFITEPDYAILSKWVINVLDYLYNYFALLIILGVWYVAVLSVRPLFSKGLKYYIRNNTLCGRIIKWLFYKLKVFYNSLISFDLKDNFNQKLLKLLGINFIIIALFCSFWFIGLILLIPYTIVTFCLLKKHINKIKQQYNLLLEATSLMSEGNLEIEIKDDLGMFNSLKDKLVMIQSGFKKAVIEETKSQKMKTELITNVSHDLKTPLTAIITYINLLKESNITEDERNSYIETLDKKSQRLKYLIEDLFEVSRAASNNITLNLVEIDIVSLIKQVQLELGDKLEDANIEFRFNMPDKKVNILLDSEKTYRVFENLFINILKYALPNTRAYIDVIDEVDRVKIILKNISAVELDLSPNEISERFVRGDKSRNTEGSGLGLAIAKSFVEIQHGEFQIAIDGDLFKVEIVWKKD
jgi:signal transduction histidine kinase